MGIKKITKTDGKRLFVEISKKQIEAEGLPKLKKGDDVLVLPHRKFTDEFLEKQINKEIGYFFLIELDNEIFFRGVRGILVKDDEKYWEKNHHPYSHILSRVYGEDIFEDGEKKYTIMALHKDMEDGIPVPITRTSAKQLSTACNVEFSHYCPPQKSEDHFCSNRKCKREVYPDRQKFCSNCGRKIKKGEK